MLVKIWTIHVFDVVGDGRGLEMSGILVQPQSLQSMDWMVGLLMQTD